MDGEHGTILDQAEIPPEYDALMEHGCECAVCLDGAQCAEGVQLMAAWEAHRPWRRRAA
ncbi:hypothetical protein ACIO3O_05265 [Streptomyces sp. NPDC087440]|uniref:hypothetical protein n=1 Tax=Streptomyces sp. NPDC087440 TaxID=3365790 RepID=UPI00382C9856